MFELKAQFLIHAGYFVMGFILNVMPALCSSRGPCLRPLTSLVLRIPANALVPHRFRMKAPSKPQLHHLGLCGTCPARGFPAQGVASRMWNPHSNPRPWVGIHSWNPHSNPGVPHQACQWISKSAPLPNLRGLVMAYTSNLPMKGIELRVHKAR